MIIFVVIVLVCSQYQYWFGTNGRGDLAALNKQISEQQSINRISKKPMKYCLPMLKIPKTDLKRWKSMPRLI